MVPWADAVAGLSDQGWTMVPNALMASVAEQVAEDDRRQWRLLGDEGGVQQHAFGSYLPFDETLPVIRALGHQLVAGLSDAARRLGLPALPRFNEVTWGRYPAGTGRISAHQDPVEYGGVIAVFTLRGYAVFRILDGQRTAAEWETGPGQLALLRGAGWPRSDSRCPVHEAMPPQVGERLILTFRYNVGGAGAGYVV